MSDIAAAARALKDRHAALLNAVAPSGPPTVDSPDGDCSECAFCRGVIDETTGRDLAYHEQDCAWRLAVEAAAAAAERLDAARERLQGGKRPGPPQLTLDLTGRG